jgi:hypothetical protein
MKWCVCSRCGCLVGECRCIPPFGGKWSSLDQIFVDDSDPNAPFGFYRPSIKLDPIIKFDPIKFDPIEPDLFSSLKCAVCGSFPCECFKKNLSE